ncbi:hypothetical protein HG536_0F02290 [Torulaspora globosa]|uniref:Putative lipoate-protein ligase A n=1 Tax=Torulaspora globosa TaxID=48254 RepID=A0A7G3ZK68_9SACH|nr:uncharacterized protein HG536_0F02290 [Torulaspora globosa]QLL33904.1 hypothetical protein HG536_0F02290 [Torulaspora globosa]
MLLVRNRLVPALRHQWSIGRRTLGQQASFDLEDGDEKYRELNQMYVDMFTPKAADALSKAEGLEEKQKISDLNELNNDMNCLLNVGYPKLTAEELRKKVELPGKFILQSLSNNPYFNLAVENYVFTNTPLSASPELSFANQRLLFYINRDSVVIGKNQTLWKEVHLKTVQERGYEVLRRFSGGGTVVHDLGNVNYSFLTSREDFSREFFNRLIIAGVQRSAPDIALDLNNRGDIVLGDRKVSGSAYKIARGKAYHHGTMLIQSKLDQFRGLLKPESIDGVTWNCNSVDSVRSQVQNVPLESVQQFIDMVVEEFRRVFCSDEVEDIPVFYCDEDVTINGEIREYMTLLESDNWKYRKGPKFEIHLQSGNYSMTVERGIIVESSIPALLGWSFQSFIDGISDFKDVDEKLIT